MVDKRTVETAKAAEKTGRNAPSVGGKRSAKNAQKGNAAYCKG